MCALSMQKILGNPGSVRRLAWPVVIVACLVTTPGWAGGVIDEALQSGAKALGRESLDEAAQKFGQAIDADGASREQLAAAYEGRCAARYKKSLVLADMALTREAIVDCNKAVANKSDHQRAYRLRGTAHLTAGETQLSLEDFNVALALDSRDHLTLQNRGLALARLGRTEKAIADFDRAIEIKPDHFWSYYNRGRLYSAQGRNEAAIEDYSAFIRFRRDYEPVYLHRGKSWMATGAYQQALVDFYESLRLKPENNGEASFFRGISLYLLERFDEAMVDFEEVRRQDDGDAINAMWLYLARERQGKSGREAFAGVRNLKEDAEWPGIMVSYMMGRSRAEQVLSAARKSEGEGHTGEIENMAIFIMGELAVLKQQSDQGKEWFARLLRKDSGAPWVHAAIRRTRNQQASKEEDVNPGRAAPSGDPAVTARTASVQPANADARDRAASMPTVRAGAPMTSLSPPVRGVRSMISSQSPVLAHSPETYPAVMAQPSVSGRFPGALQPVSVSLPVGPDGVRSGKKNGQAMDVSYEPDEKMERRSPHTPGTYAFKLASFESGEHADQALAEIAKMGLPVYVQDFNVKNHTYLRVWVGPFKSETQATSAWKKVSALSGRNPSAVRKR